MTSEGLIQVPRIDVAAKSLHASRLVDGFPTSIAQLICILLMWTPADRWTQWTGDVFKLDGLVANVETEADVLADEAFLFPGPLPEQFEKRDGLGRRFEQAERLRFDGQPNGATRFDRTRPSQAAGEQLLNALLGEVRGMLEAFETERQRRDAAFACFREESGQHGLGTSSCT